MTKKNKSIEFHARDSDEKIERLENYNANFVHEMYFDMGCAVKCLIGFVAQPLVGLFLSILLSSKKRARFHLFTGLSLYISLKSCLSPFVLFRFLHVNEKSSPKKKNTEQKQQQRKRHLVSFFGSISFLVAQHNLDEILCVFREW